MMSWLLIVVLSSGQVITERFPNQESCDSIKVWIDTYATTKKIACLPDIETAPLAEPQVHDMPESKESTSTYP